MTLDWTISIGNIISIVFGVAVVVGFLGKIERRITILEIRTEERHAENHRQFQEIKAEIRNGTS